MDAVNNFLKGLALGIQSNHEQRLDEQADFLLNKTKEGLKAPGEFLQSIAPTEQEWAAPKHQYEQEMGHETGWSGSQTVKVPLTVDEKLTKYQTALAKYPQAEQALHSILMADPDIRNEMARIAQQKMINDLNMKFQYNAQLEKVKQAGRSELQQGRDAMSIVKENMKRSTKSQETEEKRMADPFKGQKSIDIEDPMMPGSNIGKRMIAPGDTEDYTDIFYKSGKVEKNYKQWAKATIPGQQYQEGMALLWLDDPQYDDYWSNKKLYEWSKDKTLKRNLDYIKEKRGIRNNRDLIDQLESEKKKRASAKPQVAGDSTTAPGKATAGPSKSAGSFLDSMLQPPPSREIPPRIPDMWE